MSGLKRMSVLVAGAVAGAVALVLYRESEIAANARRLEEMRCRYAAVDGIRQAMGDELNAGDVRLLWSIADAGEVVA